MSKEELGPLPTYMAAEATPSVQDRMLELMKGEEDAYSLDEAYCLAVVEKHHAKYRLETSKGRLSEEECDRLIAQAILRNIPIKARWEGAVKQAKSGSVSLMKYMVPASDKAEEIGDVSIVFTSAEG